MRDAGHGGVYVPIDVSATFLSQTAATLRREYPGLTVEPADRRHLGGARTCRGGMPHPALFAFLGSTIGNFYPPAAIRLLGRVRAAMAAVRPLSHGRGPAQGLARIEAAYNDSAGVTAEFNRNMLRVLNHELGADFDPARVRALGFYEGEAHRIEMHLVSKRDQRVTIPGIGEIAFAKGESIRTEISAKYDRASVAELFAAAGFRIEAWPTDPHTPFGLVVGAPV